MFPLIVSVLWRWEPLGFVDFIRFRCFQKAIYVMNSIVMIVIQKGLTEVGLTGQMCFVCSRVNTEKFAMCNPLLSVYGWFRKLLIWTICFLF